MSASVTHAQDVAEAARQERARKAGQQESPRHVYTEEELHQGKILTPEDQAKLEARKHLPANPPVEQSAESHPIDPSPQTETLGAVARRYRREKSARAAEQAAKKNFTPFPYKIPAASLAASKPEVARRLGALPWLAPREQTTPNPEPNSRRSLPGTGTRARTSPFQPRPLPVAPPALRDSPTTPSALSDALAKPLASPLIERRASVNRLPSPEGVALRQLQVQRGQSWWTLAERYLGSGARWPELRKLNAQVNGPPELLVLGSIVMVPEIAIVGERSSVQTITVKKGDSLWILAREHFGHGSEWTRLARANPQILDYTHLAIGTTLRLRVSEAFVSSRNRSSAKLQP